MKTNDFALLLLDTARQKVEAAKARRSHPDDISQSPKEVISAALQTIALTLERDGFKYSPSQKTFKRREGDFDFSLHIQSDRNNIAGHRAAIWIHALVASRDFKHWQKSQGDPDSHGYLSGAAIGNLQNSEQWLEWDFAAPETRDAVVKGAITSIHSLAFPFFRAFLDAPEGLYKLAKTAGGLSHSVIEYAHQKFGRDVAERLGKAFYAQRNDWFPTFLALKAQIDSIGEPIQNGNINYGYAKVAAELNLDFRPD